MKIISRQPGTRDGVSGLGARQRLAQPETAGQQTRSSFAQLSPGEISETIVSGVFIHLRECGIVEDKLNESIERPADFEHGHAEVDKLCGTFPDDVDA